MIFLLAIPILPAGSPAQPMGPGMSRNGPYGHFCPGMQWGPYGIRKPVATVEQAKKLLEDYLSRDKQGLKVGRIVEMNTYFEAEIFDSNKSPVDRIIIQKRSGRIRSIY